jgi:adenylosuccinate lyase
MNRQEFAEESVMSDELPTAARVSDPGIRALYRLENRWQAWLDVEAALANAQAELGIIPRPAAEAIARAARLELLDGRGSRRGSHAPATLSFLWSGS